MMNGSSFPWFHFVAIDDCSVTRFLRLEEFAGQHSLPEAIQRLTTIVQNGHCATLLQSKSA
jgi:hypothetical protein